MRARTTPAAPFVLAFLASGCGNRATPSDAGTVQGARQDAPASVPAIDAPTRAPIATEPPPPRRAPARAPAKAREAPLVGDARAAFLSARRFTAPSIEHGVAICELRYRQGGGGDALEQAVNATAALVTLGLTEVLRNADEPDIAGIDLVLGARFGHGELYRAHGAYGAFRTFVSFPVLALRAGEPVWLRLRDEDQVSADERLGEWDLRWDGRSPIAARNGRASVECRLLPRSVVERRVAQNVRTATAAVARMRRAAPRAATRIGAARHPLDLAVPAFDVAAARADEALALARANAADRTAWPEIGAAESAFDEALAPVAAARHARLAQGFAVAPVAVTASGFATCDGAAREVLLSLYLGDAPAEGTGPPHAPRRLRIARAYALDARGLLRVVRFRPAPPLPASEGAPTLPRPFAVARLGGFDLTDRRPCATPVALLLSAGRGQWAPSVGGPAPPPAP